MNQSTIIKISKTLRFVGIAWGLIGLVIIGLTNLILIGEYDIKILFIPINPRDNVLTAIILLTPVIPIFISAVLNKKYTTKEK